MAFFSDKESSTPLNELTPLELVTHLITCLELADGRMDFEEREAWADVITELFPEHSPERAVEILQTASQSILEMNSAGRMHYAVQVCEQLKEHYSDDELKDTIFPAVQSIAEADGMVLSSESEMLSTIVESFGIKECE